MADIQLKLTEGQINNAIAVALAESLTPERRDAMIRDVVRAHLSSKAGGFGRETILSQAVNTQVTQIAQAKITEAVEALRPEIEEIVDKYLGPTFRESVVSGVDAALRGRMRLSGLNISAQWDDE